MAELSPQAQAVMDAAYDSLDKRGYVSDQVAAALRAAADRLQRRSPWPDDVWGSGVDWATGELLAIAAELEGSDEP